MDPQSPKPSYAPVCMQFFDSLHTCTLRETVRSSFDHLVLIHHFTSSLSAGKTAGTPLTQVVLLFRHARKLFCNTIVFILATLSWRDTCNGPCRSASVTFECSIETSEQIKLASVMVASFGLILIHRFFLSLLLFQNHRSLPVPIRGYHIQTLLT